MKIFDVYRKDTICALTTPYGASSAIAVIRVSGNNSICIKETIFSNKTYKPFYLMLGNVICTNTAHVIDEALCVCFPKDRSYTGELSFELYVHGSIIIINRVLKVLIDAGARLAEAGEFTFRAVLTGKLDLCKAEAIGNMINARSLDSVEIAVKDLQGRLKKHFFSIEKKLVDVLSVIECELNFDDNSHNSNINIIKKILCNILCVINKLLNISAVNDRFINGAKILLYGAPNVGKSTLMNALTNNDISIVHKSSGTTRNVVKSSIKINNLLIYLIDSAGISDNADLDCIESIGIQKTYNEMFKVDLILFIKDIHDNNIYVENMLDNTSSIVLSVINKVDLLSDDVCNIDKLNFISAKTGYGLKNLKNKIYLLLTKNIHYNTDILVTKKRQIYELKQMSLFIQKAINLIDNHQFLEIVALELHEAKFCLDRLFNHNMNYDILDKIFKDFCIGK